jgi:uncharacterized FAD-dependent dehydrogenase
VGVEPKDLARAGLRGPLAGVELQRRIEQAAFTAGGGALVAPATRMTDFVAKRGSSSVGPSSYIPGLRAGNVAEVLDCTGLTLSTRLAAGLAAFAHSMRGFMTEEALLVGVESRTSSPVRVPRGSEDLVSPDVSGLYPCGEGAGYAGGIVSAALDGVRVARAIADTSWATYMWQRTRQHL